MKLLQDIIVSISAIATVILAYRVVREGWKDFVNAWNEA